MKDLVDRFIRGDLPKHGHVRPRCDGALARCGGPALCDVCEAEFSLEDLRSTIHEELVKAGFDGSAKATPENVARSKEVILRVLKEHFKDSPHFQTDENEGEPADG